MLFFLSFFFFCLYWLLVWAFLVVGKTDGMGWLGRLGSLTAGDAPRWWKGTLLLQSLDGSSEDEKSKAIPSVAMFV